MTCSWRCAASSTLSSPLGPHGVYRLPDSKHLQVRLLGSVPRRKISSRCGGRLPTPCNLYLTLLQRPLREDIRPFALSGVNSFAVRLGVEGDGLGHVSGLNNLDQFALEYGNPHYAAPLFRSCPSYKKYQGKLRNPKPCPRYPRRSPPGPPRSPPPRNPTLSFADP